MKAIIYERYGAPEVLHPVEIEKPVPKDNEVLVKIYATTVTSGDVRMRTANPVLVRAFNGFLKPKNKILGVEFSGIVEQAGKGVTKFKINDEVFGTSSLDMGTYSEYKCIPEDGAIAVKPVKLKFEDAAAVSFGGLTALHFLQKGNIQKGEKVLVYGASGSLGTAAVQIAKSFGAEVTAVCSSANAELVKSLGADSIIDYTKEDFTSSGNKYDIIFDTVGKSPFGRSVKSLNEKGFYLRAVHINPSSIVKGMWANAVSGKKVIGGISHDTKDNLLVLKDLIEKDEFKPVVDKVFPIEQIVEAHRYVEQGHKIGNVVIQVSS